MRGILAVFYRDYRQRITNIGWLFWDLFVPVAYLVLFGTGRLPRLMEDLGKGLNSFKKGLKEDETKSVEDKTKE